MDILFGLTQAETHEFEALDAAPPIDFQGNVTWSFEGSPSTETNTVGCSCITSIGCAGRIPITRIRISGVTAS